MMDRGTYVGDTKLITTANGEQVHIRHGRGTYVYPNAFFRYTGDWVNGVKHGQGQLTLGNSIFYDCHFVNGEMDGYGLKTWVEGERQSTYSGQLVKGEMQGQGVYMDASGEKYEGSFHANCRHGYGELSLSNGARYIGTFENHRMHGEGEYSWDDGSRCTGTWVAGHRSGHCIEKHASGDIYDGSFVLDHREGEGTYIHAASHINYTGPWIKGVRAIEPTTMRIRCWRALWIPDPIPENDKTEKKKKIVNKRTSAPSVPTSPSNTPSSPAVASSHAETTPTSSMIPGLERIGAGGIGATHSPGAVVERIKKSATSSSPSSKLTKKQEAEKKVKEDEMEATTRAHVTEGVIQVNLSQVDVKQMPVLIPVQASVTFSEEAKPDETAPSSHALLRVIDFPSYPSSRAGLIYVEPGHACVPLYVCITNHIGTTCSYENGRTIKIYIRCKKEDPVTAPTRPITGASDVDDEDHPKSVIAFCTCDQKKVETSSTITTARTTSSTSSSPSPSRASKDKSKTTTPAPYFVCTGACTVDPTQPACTEITRTCTSGYVSLSSLYFASLCTPGTFFDLVIEDITSGLDQHQDETSFDRSGLEGLGTKMATIPDPVKFQRLPTTSITMSTTGSVPVVRKKKLGAAATKPKT